MTAPLDARTLEEVAKALDTLRANRKVLVEQMADGRRVKPFAQGVLAGLAVAAGRVRALADAEREGGA